MLPTFSSTRWSLYVPSIKWECRSGERTTVCHLAPPCTVGVLRWVERAKQVGWATWAELLIDISLEWQAKFKLR
jgi:hypothetical protein